MAVVAVCGGGVQGAPLGRDYGQFMAAARVSVSGLVPSIAKAWRASGCMQVWGGGGIQPSE